MKAGEIVEIMERHFPLSLQEEWDVSGFQCGHYEQEVHKIMIALDCDLRTIREAIAKGCDMLITHHPFLFKRLDLNLSGYVGTCIEEAIKNDLVIYSSHTPLDKVAMNNWLCEELGLIEVGECEETGIAKAGKLQEEMSLNDFIEHVKNVFHLDYVRIAGDKEIIHTVAVCGGAGADFIHNIDVDAYLTGDIKYHAGEDSTICDMVLVDVGHHVEVIMVEKLKELLQEEIAAEIITSTSPDYFRFA